MNIVNREEWLWNPTKFVVVGFCSLFWSWPCTNHNNCLLRTEELANGNVFYWLRNSCIVYKHKTKDCALWTFQPKSWHLCLLLWCLPGFITIQLCCERMAFRTGYWFLRLSGPLPWERGWVIIGVKTFTFCMFSCLTTCNHITCNHIPCVLYMYKKRSDVFW